MTGKMGGTVTGILWDEAIRLILALRTAGYEAYFAGGCVRDHVMGVAAKDVDIATSARPEEVQSLFPCTQAVGAHFGVVRVHTDTATFEVSTFRTDIGYSDGRHPDVVRFATAREDVERRDFTINGMLYDPLTGEVLDWVGGREDIRRRIVRAIGDPDARFAEDRLRLLRAIRFAARLDFAIEEATRTALLSHAPAVIEVSAERIRDELLAIITGVHAGRALRQMHETGLLAPILPEVEAMVGVRQPPQFHPEGDVFDHTCLMLDAAETPSPELAMAILLHDAGKPPTRSFDGRIRFNKHDRVGAQLAGDALRRLRCSSEQVAQVQSLVAEHMRLAQAPKMKTGKLKQLLGLPRFGDHLELHRLDCVASHRKLDVYHFLVRKREEFREEDLHPAPLLTGHDLIDLGYTPGPLFGEILDEVRERQFEGGLADRAAAVAWVKAHYPLESHA
jgi:poly(A) polymerase